MLSATATATYLTQQPPTVYEDPNISPQNMDYDRENNMFVAHPGWLNDKLIHYYKFRMYTPATYPTRVPMQDPPSIPIAALYLLTSSPDGFTGLILEQKPVIRYHTVDGEDYSDFVQVHWVVVGSGYVANTYKSYGDIVDQVPSENIVPTSIYANLPVVPTGSKLQDPIALGTNAAPIKPLMVWYRGVEVQTFVFETTSQQFADHFNSVTREGTAANQGSGYEITVSQLVADGSVRSIPIFHLNQYSTGVVAGENHGGPWNGGGRNIIGFDRRDSGYSPLWQVFWVSGVPIDYTADMASNPAQLTDANGFKVDATPMFVNCPDVGPHGGGTLNSRKASSFSRSLGQSGNFTIAGSLVMEADKTVRAFLGEKELASGRTNMMGAYAFQLSSEKLPEGQSTITVKDEAGNIVQEFLVTKAAGGIFGILPVVPTIAGIVIAFIVATGVLLYRRSKKLARTPNIPAPKQ